MGKDILLVTVLRSSNEDANNVSGNPDRAPAATDKQKWKRVTNKCVRSVTTALQNKEPKTGSPTSLTNKTTLKNSSCNRCWELRDRIFKVLEPDGLGESNSL